MKELQNAIRTLYTVNPQLQELNGLGTLPL